MADVVLVFPTTGVGAREYRMLPLSVLSIAAPLDAAGYEVCVIDQRGNRDWQAELAAELDSPDLAMVGISSMTGPQIAGGLEASRIVKEKVPHISVVWGGVHPTLLPKQTVSHPLVDVVVVGEGEETTLDVVRAIKSRTALSSVDGIYYKRNGEIVSTPKRPFLDLATLPEPAYHLINVSDYIVAPLRTKEKSLAFITSRGCPFRCGYCYNLEYNARRWRALPAEEVVRRMLSLRQRFDLSGVFLLDDNFFVDRERVREICRLLIEEKVKLAIHNANCRADTVVKFDDELLAMMKEAGFTQLLIGVESGSPRVLGDIKKDLRIEQVLQANQVLKRHGIKPYYAFMAGFPSETIEDVKMTLGLMRRLLDENTDALVPKIAILSPFPGTELLDTCLERGLETPEDLEGWVTWNYAKVNYGAFSRRHRAFLRKALITSYFMDPKCMELKNPVLKSIGNLYSKVVERRARSGVYTFMPELNLVRAAWKFKEVMQGAGAE